MNTFPVLLSQCNRYDPVALYAQIDKHASALGIQCRGSIVLLKPNLITYRAPHIACTNAAFIAEVARWFLDHGARVVVGDSPAYGNVRGVMKHHGILAALQPLAVEIIEFSKTRKVQLADGTKIKVAAAPYECDLLINLPKVKAHSQMYVTLAMKNLFGLVKGHKKALLHISHGQSREVFSKMLLEFIDNLPQTFTFVDGIKVMHKAGPIKGEPLFLNCLAAGSNPVALDRALMAVLELNVKRNPLLMEARDQKIGGSRMGDISFPMLSPKDFEGAGFEPPEVLKPITFHPLKLAVSMMKRTLMRMRS